jgi:ERO1-like protein alpha
MAGVVAPVRFNNISSIMDCVSCEKCRLWGKLQILGIRSAIKILLTPLEELDAFHSRDFDPAGSTCSTSEAARKRVLGRDEVIALLNTLNQFSNSLLFAAEASAMEVEASSSP